MVFSWVRDDRTSSTGMTVKQGTADIGRGLLIEGENGELIVTCDATTSLPNQRKRTTAYGVTSNINGSKAGDYVMYACLLNEDTDTEDVVVWVETEARLIIHEFNDAS